MSEREPPAVDNSTLVETPERYVQSTHKPFLEGLTDLPHVRKYREETKGTVSDTSTDQVMEDSLTPPDEASAYGKIMETPFGMEADMELQQNAMSWFHDAQIPVDIAHGIVSQWNVYAANPPGEEARLAEGTATAEKLNSEWGADADKRIAAVQALIPESAHRYLEESGFGNSYWLIKTLDNLLQYRGKPA